MKRQLRVPVSTPNRTIAEITAALDLASATARAAGVPADARVTLVASVRGGLSAVRFAWDPDR